MSIGALEMSTLTAAVSVIGNEYFKGVASEAGKATWTGIKALFGWKFDPELAEIPAKIEAGLTTSPEMTEKLVALLKSSQTGAVTAFVGKLKVSGGKVVIASEVHEIHM